MSTINSASGNPASGQPGEIDTNPKGAQILAEHGIPGGLIVLVGCNDAELAISFADAPNVLVQGLVPDSKRLETVRSQICDADLYGRVSAISWQGPVLPYASGLVLRFAHIFLRWPGVEFENCLVQDAGDCEGALVWCVTMDGSWGTLRPRVARRC